MIKVENLKKEFRKSIKEPGLKGSFKALFKPRYDVVKAVDGISFDVHKGEIIGFIGPNGAGKSTVIKMLTGILTPTGGVCTIDGKIPTENRKAYVKEIGVVFAKVLEHAGVFARNEQGLAAFKRFAESVK